MRESKKASKRKAWERHISKTYGITAEQYDAILKVQGGKCALCRRATGATKALAVDHDHETGAVRGICCGVCNKILGHFRDDPEAFRRGTEYLVHPPADYVLFGGPADE